MKEELKILNIVGRRSDGAKKKRINLEKIKKREKEGGGYTWLSSGTNRTGSLLMVEGLCIQKEIRRLGSFIYY
jgi:hypothetical protein